MRQGTSAVDGYGRRLFLMYLECTSGRDRFDHNIFSRTVLRGAGVLEQFYYEYRREHKNIELKQYIYRIGSYHYNWHSDLELLLVLNGEVEMCTRGASHILGKDDLILVNSNCGHATLARQPDSIAMVLHINPVFFKRIL